MNEIFKQKILNDQFNLLKHQKTRLEFYSKKFNLIEMLYKLRCFFFLSVFFSFISETHQLYGHCFRLIVTSIITRWMMQNKINNRGRKKRQFCLFSHVKCPCLCSKTMQQLIRFLFKSLNKKHFCTLYKMLSIKK